MAKEKEVARVKGKARERAVGRATPRMVTAGEMPNAAAMQTVRVSWTNLPQLLLH